MKVLGSPRGRRVCVDGLLWVGAVASMWLSDDPLPEYAFLDTAALRGCGAVVLGVAVGVWRRWPGLAAALPLLAGVVVADDVHVAQLAPSVVVFAFLLGRAAGGRVGVLVAGAALALVLVPGRPGGEDWFTAASTLFLLVLGPWAVGRYLRAQADLAAAGFELAARAAEHERLRERTRIASDMHDSLGHELSLLAVRAAAVQVAADATPALRQAAAELRESAATATDRLRQVIGLLRQDGEPPEGSVAALVARAAASGVDVRLDGDEETAAAGLPGPVLQTAARVVQEGLTNATKHAPGSAVRVRLHPTADSLEVTIANGPPTRAGGAAQAGYGLVGLAERVRPAGGTLEAGPDGDGFRLRARLPAYAPPETPTRQALAAARQRLRRGLVTMFWAPGVLVVVLVAVFLLRGGT
ncbi:sensor histidine kinase [Spongiactinospora rosea]|uniref:sensor histidine kinase n=1 Tax=Spongiactinospora rosea TaxID=2248750 RepID=UPI0011C04F74|nr:histidine kinase [Spongiactinospora rosea]